MSPRDWLEILQEMEQWSRDMDRFMTHVNTRSRSLPSSMNFVTWSPSVNIYETEDSLLVLAELAGVGTEAIHIRYEGNRLLVWGQRHQSIPDGILAVHRMEIEMGPFAFIVELPGSVSADEADARLDDGILQIRLSKRSTAKTGFIPVKTVLKNQKENANE